MNERFNLKRNGVSMKLGESADNVREDRLMGLAVAQPLTRSTHSSEWDGKTKTPNGGLDICESVIQITD